MLPLILIVVDEMPPLCRREIALGRAMAELGLDIIFYDIRLEILGATCRR